MSFLSSRRRKLLFAAVSLAASGYASYHIYKSAAFVRQRERFLQILSTLSFCCEAASQSAESLFILSSDLKSFLLSDEDTVPQSLRQAFKVGQSEEFQGSVTVLSAALARGLLRGMSANSRKESLLHGHGHGQLIKQGPHGNESCKDVVCREIREVCFTAKGQEQPRMDGDKECMLRLRAETGGYDYSEREVKSYSSVSDTNAQRVGLVLDKARRAKTSEGLVEKLVSKMFSEPGVGFASAVSGALARNLVLAFFDASRNRISSSGKHSRSFSSKCKHASQAEMESVPTYAKVVDVLQSAPCKTLIAECMQTFISTAVTVYVDKTKDVNFCEDVVAGITNPSHKDSVKEMMATVCNGAIDTLVRTTYDVLREGQGGVKAGYEHAGRSKADIRECSMSTAINGQLPCSTGSDPEASSYMVTMAMIQEENTGSFIDGVSKTLAIPSNRKLIVDVAGTISSEAVRSLVNVVASAASSHLRGSWNTLRNYVSDHQGLQLQERGRDLDAKAFVLASICLAICLHLLAASQFLQA